MPKYIVDSIEQCCSNSIVASCFQRNMCVSCKKVLVVYLSFISMVFFRVLRCFSFSKINTLRYKEYTKNWRKFQKGCKACSYGKSLQAKSRLVMKIIWNVTQRSYDTKVFPCPEISLLDRKMYGPYENNFLSCLYNIHVTPENFTP